MKSFSDCLKKHGLDQFERDLLTTRREALLEGKEAADGHQAALMAVNAYESELLDQRDAIYKAIGQEAPARETKKAPEPPKVEPPKEPPKVEPPKPEGPTSKEQKQARRKLEGDLFNLLRNNVDLHNLHAASAVDFKTAVDALVAQYVSQQREGADAVTKLALDSLSVQQLELKFYESLQKQAGVEYRRAQKEGEQKKKLENTGDDLRRHWELVKAERKKRDDATGVTTLNAIIASTSRADLFTGILGKDATPGAERYLALMRDGTKTFKEWLFGDYGLLSSTSGKWMDERAYNERLQAFVKGDIYPYGDKGAQLYSGIIEAEPGKDFRNATLDQRLDALTNAADTYIESVRSLTDLVKDNTKMAQMTEGIWTLFKQPAEYSRWLSEKSMTPAGWRLYDNKGVHILNDKFVHVRPDMGTVSRMLGSEDNPTAENQRKQPLVPPRLEKITREGLPAAREGNVTPAQTKKQFGFADIGFGTWVAKKEDQANLNLAWDSFSDLARFLGIDPTHIGFKGRLHFVIGALGHGAKAAATFHPMHPGPDGGFVQAINLTKTKGDGTVAHEWGHAFDHFVRGAGGDTAIKDVLGMLKTVYRPEILRERAVAALKGHTQMVSRGSKGRRISLQSDDAQLIANASAIVDYYTKGSTSKYKGNADAMDPEYWGNDAELFARAWEAWISDNLGGVNDYLVNPAWVGDGLVKPPAYKGIPYPMGDERKFFARVFNALRSSIKQDGDKITIDIDKWNADRPRPDEEMRKAAADLKAELPQLLEQLRYEALANTPEAKAAEAEAQRKLAEEAAKAAREAEERERAQQEPVVPPPPAGALSDDDLENMFDDAAESARAEANEDATAPDPGQPAAEERIRPPTTTKQTTLNPEHEKTAGQLINEAAKLGVKGADEALKGLTKLFGGGRFQSFPGGMDEATYKEAKPHFEAALKAFQAAGKTLKDLFKLLFQQFGEQVKPYAIHFAKEMKLTANLGSETSASRRLSEWVRDEIAAGNEIAWKSLFDKADEAYGGTQAEGKYAPKDAYDAAEAGMNLYVMGAGGAFSPSARPAAADARRVIESLKQRTSLLPTQTKRTQEQDEFQQFSTPPGLAYSATWVANVQPNELMGETSAGVGGIAAFGQVAGARLFLNELSSRRAEVLREVLPNARVETEKGEQVHNLFPDDRPTVVVINPPFSATAGRVPGQRDTMNGAAHLEAALKWLKPGGRLVAIVGNGMDDGKPAFTGWWTKIKSEYTVRANLNLSGEEYAKYGTTFDNNLVVIDKIGPQAGTPVVTGRVEAYSQLPALLEGVRNARTLPSASDSAVEQPAPEQGGGGTTAPGLEQPVGPARPDTGAVGGAGEGARNGGGSGTGTTTAGGGPQGGNAVGNPNAGGGRDTGPGRPGGAGTGGGGDVSVGEHHGPDGLAELDASGAAARTRELTETTFEQYEPRKAILKGSKPHPGKLVESAAMASVDPIDPTYVPNLPQNIIDSGALSSAQIEPIIYAGQAHQQHLPTGERRGYFIGDGTGVGKGREISGIILDNMRQGRKKAVWISAASGLIKDARRDWTGVGGKAEDIFGFRNAKEGGAEPAGSISRGNGIAFLTYDTLKGGEKPDFSKSGLAKGSTVVIGNPFGPNNGTTKLVKIDKNKKTVTVEQNGKQTVHPWAQVVSIGGNADWMSKFEKAGAGSMTSIKQLIEWVGKDFDGVIAFDEAHKMQNLGGQKGARGKTKPAQRAVIAQELRKELPQARIVFVSATGATEVANLGYLDRLGLWGEGTAFATQEDLVSKIAATGLASMELVARDMKAMGSYISRSLSYDGVEQERIDASFTPLQHDIYNELAQAWQIIIQNVHSALEDSGQGKNGQAKGATMSALWSTQQRFFNQVITAMMAPTVLDHAKKQVDAGHAVVFQLVNTNEAAQERAVERAEAEDVALEELDFTPKQGMIEYLKKSFPVAQYEESVDENGNKVYVPVRDSEGNPVLNQELVKQRDELIKHVEDNLRVPDNPLDLIYEAFGEKNVGEVSGRGRRFQRVMNRDGSFTLEERKRTGASNQADADAFMDDRKKVLAFTDAGGTGFSFDSDRNVKNQRRRYHYLLQPGWIAANAVQGIGRTHRSNEANQPMVLLPESNLKAQKRFISSIARRLDQLGALTRGQRDTTSQGLFKASDNLESKYAVAALRQLIEDMAPQARGKTGGTVGNAASLVHAMGFDDIYDPKEGTLIEGKMPPVQRFLNRLLSLTIEQQDEIFQEFEMRLDAAVQAAIERGTFDDGMQTLHAIKVVKTRDDTIYVDERTKAETRFVELELTKPTTLNDWQTVLTQLKLHPGKGSQFYFDNQTQQPFAVVDQGARLNSKGQLEQRGYRFNVRAPSAASRGQFITNRDTIEKGGGTHVFRQEETVKPETVDLSHMQPGLTVEGPKTKTHERRGPRYEKIGPDVAEYLWNEALAEAPKTYTEPTAILTGILLPVWDRIQVGDTERTAAVVRTQTDDGERFIGRVVRPDDRVDILKNFGLGDVDAKMPVERIIARIMAGESARLSNGWIVKKSKVSNETRLEIVTQYVAPSEIKLLQQQGAFVERISYRDRIFIPTGKNEVFERITRGSNRPVVEFFGKDALLSLAARGVRAASGQTVEGLQTFADALKKSWKNAPPIVVVQRTTDLPFPVPPATRGAFWNGSVYLVADNIPDLKAAGFVILHETMGHYGLAGVLGPELRKMMQRIYTSNPAVRAAANARILHYRENGRELDVPTATEEALADMAGSGKLSQVTGWQMLLAAIRAGLRKLGFDLSLSDDEVALLLKNARQYVREGGESLQREPEQGKLSLREAGEAFRNWFSGSKVVDAEGKPLVVYHGTTADFSVFDKKMAQSRGGKIGFFFTPSTEAANQWTKPRDRKPEHGGAIMPVYLSIKNPLRVSVTRWVVDQDPKKYERAALKGGHDGIILEANDGNDYYGGDVFVAFRPEQIKSATGNSGAFDPNEADIRLSLGPMFMLGQDGIVGAAKQAVLDRFSYDGKSMSWLNRTINTQFHKAEKDPYFRRVYQGVQRFIADVNEFANDAADLAGENVLPRMRDLSDVWFNPFKFSNWKKEKQLQRDMKSIGHVVWAGTLADRRPTDAQLVNGFTSAVLDSNGKMVGTVSAPGLSPEQINLYRGIRKAIDLSLDQGGASEMVKIARADKMERKLPPLDEARAAAKDDPENAAQILIGALTDRLQTIEEMRNLGAITEYDAADYKKSTLSTIAKIEQKAKLIQKLQDDGYAPLMRFGHYTVKVMVPKDGRENVLYFGMFDSIKDANVMGREMLAELRQREPDAVLVRGTMDTEAWKQMRGLSLDTLQAFASITEIDQDEAVQEYLKMAISSRNAMKRLIHRKKIGGFDEDLQRVLATFITSQARLASRNYHFGELLEATSAIPQEMGETRTEAAQLTGYVQNPGEEAQGIRGFLFLQYLGGSIASALTNITQPVLMTLPYLSQFEPKRGLAGVLAAPTVAAKVLATALKVVAKGTDNETLRKAMDLAAAEGVTEPQEIHQLYAESIRSGVGGRSLYTRKALRLWGATFSLSESFNRKVTFVAAFELAGGTSSPEARARMMQSINEKRAEDKRQPFTSPYDFAVNAVNETQGVYNKGNRPNWARGAVGSTIFTFKQFSISYVEFLSRLPPREKAIALAILVTAAGAEGLPFEDDLVDLWDTIWQALGFSSNAKKSIRAWATKTLGEAAGGFLTGGLSNIPGSPIDVSGRLGVGNLIPGTALFARSTADATREVAEWVGPVGSMLMSAKQAVSAAEEGQYRTAVYNVVPKAIRDAMQAMDMYQTGYYRDLKGRRVVDTTGVDAAFKAIGIMPYGVAQEGKRRQDIQQDVALHNVVEASIADRWARGIVDKDETEVKKAITDLFAWNQRNPGLPIAINPQQIIERVRAAQMTAAQRQMKATPREIRSQEFVR